MDIPYTVKPRQDTGLYNAKVGIWLFLASEVMLFGGLFSAYIFLRVGAPAGTWPHGWLNVKLGTLNTLILALSAITTLLGWVALKMNQFPRYKVLASVTILLAITFLCIKGYEYGDKFRHYEVQLQDGRIADGHMIPNRKDADHIVLHGRYVERHADLMEGHVAGEQDSELTIARADIKRMQNYGPAHNTYLAIYFCLTILHALHILGGAIVMAYLRWPGSRMWHTDPARFTNRVEVSGLFWHFVDLVWIFLFPVLYLT
jgi:cytochrome c oxidase subunit 3